MSGKCKGNLKFFKDRELSGNFIICQGKLNFCKNVREMSGNFRISNEKKKKKKKRNTENG